MRVSKYSEKFYSKSSAMEIDLSDNGIFFSIARFKEVDQNGNNNYDWENKKTAKLSISEVCHLEESLISFRKEGISGYQKYAEWLIGKNYKFKNVQFIHKNNNSITRLGWKLNKDWLCFIINNNNEEVFYALQIIDIIKLEKFLGFILTQAFHKFTKIEYISQQESNTSISMPTEDLNSNESDIFDISLQNTSQLDNLPSLDIVKQEDVLPVEPNKLVDENDENERKRKAVGEIRKAFTLEDVEFVIDKYYEYKDNKKFLDIASNQMKLIMKRENAFRDIKKCKSIESFEKVINKYSQLKNDPIFIEFANKKQKEIKNYKKDMEQAFKSSSPINSFS